jgi:Cof subfamily protein (haloacid dehalogenase superfamily)
MAEYKIVATDLDGTLLNSHGRVSGENWEAIAQMTARGVQFVPCTGRTLHEMDPAIRDNPYVRYIIHSDGAVIYDKKTDRRMTMCMPQALTSRLFDVLDEYSTLMAVRYARNVYMNAEQMNGETMDAFGIDPYSRTEVMPRSTKVRDFARLCRSMEEIEMIGVFFHTVQERDACIARLEAMDEFLFARWVGLNYCEIFSKRAGKGNALLRLADEIGCTHAETIGVGDSTNDWTLIPSAGLGLAMKNAFESLKSEADEVICHCDEHAMQYILNHYL